MEILHSRLDSPFDRLESQRRSRSYRECFTCWLLIPTATYFTRFRFVFSSFVSHQRQGRHMLSIALRAVDHDAARDAARADEISFR